jgi:uncharacterized membrane protein
MKNKPFVCSLLLAIGGGALALLSAVLLILQFLHGTATLSVVSLLLTLCGGGFLTFFALRSLRLLKSEQPAETLSKKESALLLTQTRQAQNGRLSRMLSLLILTLAAILFFWAYDAAREVEGAPKSAEVAGIFYEKATVLEVQKNQYQNLQDAEDQLTGKQLLRIEMTSGRDKGRQFSNVENVFNIYKGCVVEEGDDITVAVAYDENGSIYDLDVQDYDRTKPLLIVLLLFVAITILVGGKVGAKSLLSLTLSFVCMFAVVIPLLIGGAPTLPTILLMCAYVTVVDFVILDGVNKKTLCAILGTVSGVVFAALFSELACALLRLNGYKTYVTEPTVEALVLLKQQQPLNKSLQIGDLLAGGILIATLGAVNDVAMSISSAMNELIAVNPDLSRRKLFKSGMSIGRDMVGTMTNTLILAFVGASLVVMIFLVTNDPTMQQLMSSAYLSLEVIQGVASSVGVVLAVPLSVFIGTLLYGHKKSTK